MNHFIKMIFYFFIKKIINIDLSKFVLDFTESNKSLKILLSN
jgi:hypothetical protein